MPALRGGGGIAADLIGESEGFRQLPDCALCSPHRASLDALSTEACRAASIAAQLLPCGISREADEDDIYPPYL